MQTLKQFTDAIVAAGCYKPRMERTYKRRDHREVLIFAWQEVGEKPTEKVRKAKAAEVYKKLRDAGFELTYESWDYVKGEPNRITVMAKVALAEGF